MSGIASWFFNTAGVGGVVVVGVILIAAGIYSFLIRWILRGGEESGERHRRRHR